MAITYDDGPMFNVPPDMDVDTLRVIAAMEGLVPPFKLRVTHNEGHYTEVYCEDLEALCTQYRRFRPSYDDLLKGYQ